MSNFLLSLSNLWITRYLIWNLALSDLKLKYKNSILGFAWTIIEPLLMLTVLYFVFSTIFKNDIENFALYLLIGIIFWNMFSRSTSMSTLSILNKSSVVNSMYFPREILVVSSVLTSFMMMMFEFVVLAAFFIGLQFIPPISAILIIPFLAILFVLSLGISLALSVLHVHYRDVSFIWGVILQIGFFLSPIIYSLDLLPENIRQLVLLSPIAQIIESTHNLILYQIYPSLFSVGYLLAITCIVLIIGIVIFRKLNPDIVEKL